jgi:Fe2+ transport system protein FeoA
MPRPPKKKPVGAKLRNWRVAIMRSRAQQIGTVAAADRATAEAAAVKAFDLSEDQRKRLMILERK